MEYELKIDDDGNTQIKYFCGNSEEFEQLKEQIKRGKPNARKKIK